MGLFKPNVEKMEKKRDVKGLIKALKHKDYLIRLRATEALGNIGDKGAVEPLTRALDDEPRHIRHVAVVSLGNIGDKGAVEPLIKLLKDEDALLQEETAKVIERWGRTKNAERFIETLKEKHRNIQLEILKSLGKIGDVRAVEPIVGLLKDESSNHRFIESSIVRENAAEVLVKIGKPAVEPLIQALKSARTLFRSEVLGVLGNMGDIRAVEPLIQALKDENDYIRSTAALALGKIGDARAVEPLIQALKEWNVIIRWHAAVALGKIGDVRAVEPLIKVLNDEKRKEAAEALGLIGDLRAAEAIINWLFIYLSGFYYHEVPDTITATMRNLFGDYTDLILKACIRGKQVQYGDADNGGFDYDLHESDETIHKLCTINTRISSNILHKVSQKKDIEVLVSWDCVSNYYGTLSFEAQREMAKKELERRGNPPYDPSAYLNKEAWKL